MIDTKPLAGIRVVDFSTYAAAPGAARILADQGAEVIKIESPMGDPHRTIGALVNMPTAEAFNPAFDIENANKQFVCIDVRTQKGKEIFHKLLAEADVLITNYREDALARLGARYEDLKEKFPRLVYGFVSGYGESGPLAGKPGYDIVAYFAKSGFMLDTVTTESFPLINIGAAGDHPSAVALAQGVAAALVKQARIGKGEKVSISLYHVAIWTLGYLICSTQFNNKYPKPYLEPPLGPLLHPYKCADDEWIFVMIVDFKYLTSFYTSLGIPELATNEDFNSFSTVQKNQERLMEILIERIKTKTAKEWSEIWRKLDIPHDVLQHMCDVINDQQAIVNQFIRKVDYRGNGQFYLPTPPIQFLEAAAPEYKTTGRVGTDTMKVLQKLGYSEDEVKKLEIAGIVKY